MLKFSANVGFLWGDLELPDRIRRAKAAGFDAVECHFPYEHPAAEIAAVLKETNFKMVGINTRLDKDRGEQFGLASLPGQELAAKELIDQAIEYAHAIGAINVNVVAGLTKGAVEAEEIYRSNLIYACKKAAEHKIGILIEPLNPRSVPDYHFSRVEEAITTIAAVNRPNLKLMFDFFHAQIVQGDLLWLLSENIDSIGHVQISAVHDRGEPDAGEINYPFVLGELDRLGYTGFIGAEYKPRGESVEAGIDWLHAYR